MEDLKRGYRFFTENTSGIIGANISNNYVLEINQEIDKLEEHMNNEFKGFKTPSKILKGDVMEYWHSDTFNINSAVAASKNTTHVNRSHEFASSDISSNYGEHYGVKAYDTGIESAKAQSVNVFQRYAKYKGAGGMDDIDKFLSDRNLEKGLNDSIYSGQVRIIPCDQLEDAKKWLEKMIKTESERRPEQVHRYEETLKFIDDRLRDNKGVESIPISKEDAQKLAVLAKQGEFKAEEFKLTTEELIKYKDVMREATKAGVKAATISMMLKVAPEIYKAISYLIKNGEIDQGRFKKVGFAALSGASEGFIRGTVAAAITTCCKKGLFGEMAKNISPAVIGSVTVIAINTMKNSYSVATGKATRGQMADNIARDMYLSAVSLICGGVAQSTIGIPVFGYMIGSFIGSVVGSFSYSIGKKAVISFCVDSGFTMFGLVEQDYTLPKEIIKDMGINTFDYESFEMESFQPETFELETFSVDTFEPDSLDITFLRRGVIGVSRVGYV